MLKKIGQHKTQGGWVQNFTHPSANTNGDMTFAIFIPPQAQSNPVPVLYWLSGLTCNHENFMQKAGAQAYAAKHGIALVAPDTSPRGAGINGEDDAYDFGSGAGFYVDATQAPWSDHYNMYSYITKELPALIEAEFPVNNKRSISGHSMGGHGALTIALKNPTDFCSVSAFAPICSPTRCPWGEKALTGYLGEDRSLWNQYDATLLIDDLKDDSGAKDLPWLVDQGGNDDFLSEQLKPELLAEAAERKGLNLTLRIHDGYDHSYYFISTLIEEHIAFHATALK